MSDVVSLQQFTAWLDRAADVFVQNKDRLTELDSAIGDGDHGSNMARGFTAVRAKLPEISTKDIGTLFKGVAMTLISTVGGASGPLYGTFFLQAATTGNGKTSLTLAELSAAFDAGVKGVMMRGKAVVGDKTMVDVLAPSAESLHPIDGDTLTAALARTLEVARKSADATIPLIARKGRASYLGERSANHLDPGAASSVLLLETLNAVLT